MNVLDSSIFASILIKDEFYEDAISFVKKHLKRENITIELSFVEVANTLWKHTYILKRIPKDKYEILRDSIKPLISNVAHIHTYIEILEEAIDNAVHLGISVYDSLYVTLALSKKCKLISFDERLKGILADKGLGDIIIKPS